MMYYGAKFLCAQNICLYVCKIYCTFSTFIGQIRKNVLLSYIRPCSNIVSNNNFLLDCHEVIVAKYSIINNQTFHMFRVQIYYVILDKSFC